MEDEQKVGLGAPLRAYLDLAFRYYEEDRLDASMHVVLDAFESTGWPDGLWTAFYNELVCEKDARDAAALHQVDERLSIELPRGEPVEVGEALKGLALQARTQVGELLEVEYLRPVMVTVFLPEAPVDFIVGSHGYVSHKAGLEKVCIPHDTILDRDAARDTLIHEFSHVAAYELAGDALPRWPNEGLATYLCGDLTTRHGKLTIRKAAREGRLLKVSRLESVLNSADKYKADPDAMDAAYLLSGSLVAFWTGQYSLASVREALVRIGQGESVKRAIRGAAGVSLGRLEHGWRCTLQEGKPRK